MNELRRLQTDRALRAALPREENEEPLSILATATRWFLQNEIPLPDPTDVFAPLLRGMDCEIAEMKQKQKLCDRLVKETV